MRNDVAHVRIGADGAQKQKGVHDEKFWDKLLQPFWQAFFHGQNTNYF